MHLDSTKVVRERGTGRAVSATDGADGERNGVLARNNRKDGLPPGQSDVEPASGTNK